MTTAPTTPTTDGDSLPFPAALYTVFLCMLFGANNVAVKISLTGVGIYTNAGLRFGGAALFLLAWGVTTGKPLRISARQLLQMTIFTAIFFFQITFFYMGLRLTSASHGVLISNLLPFVVMLLAHHLLPNDRITRKKVLGLVLGFAGVFLLFIDSAASPHSSLHGNLLIAIGVLLWGCNAVFVKKIISDYTPLQITIYPMLIGAPIYLLCGVLFDTPMIAEVDTPIVLAMLYQTLVTTTFGFLAWNRLIQQYGATALHAFIFIMPLSGVFFGVTLLGEPVTSALLGSILLVTCGLVVINRR